MSDQTDTGTGELAPMPDPQIEPGEPNPGGADAVEEPVAAADERTIPDLTPAENPAIDDSTPDTLQEQMSGSEDTSTEATEASPAEAGAQDEGAAEQGKAE
ncbi:hypothetical protein [Nocardioides marmotae]|uniref:Uncharacterized protein n=1 Tax=Nocardioides marmotae TaxID=2663857 RepID=A0A6I3J925_9ACTN|nr:hypothetical protein [Nocardioides marmotae]MCR6030308.1 hypothetical protein [Gordonia jinghuaiqii]MBC9734401.1 hypothetical protein [Nocardioides marmotae]MTB85501.1 hypothetical protein [Nocardioides marmotae]MTB93940.1 hypothetical protein [Nocardioides marmotae]QKE00256.1 hypothetical protein HPC71_03560 [Nocardioides marmotae]